MGGWIDVWMGKSLGVKVEGGDVHREGCAGEGIFR